MAELLGPGGGTPHATPSIPCKPQVGDFGEKVRGSVAMGWRPDLQEEITNAGKPHKPDVVAAEHQEYLHLQWNKARPTIQCWWCQYPLQTRDHFFKVCPE